MSDPYQIPVDLSLYESFYDSLATSQNRETTDSGYLTLHGTLDLKEHVTKKTLHVEYDFYRPDNFNKKLVVLTPNIEGLTPLEHFLRRYLTSYGYAVLIVHALPFDVDFNKTTARQFELLNIQWLISIRRVLDILAHDQGFDETSIGLVGASLGGIRSSILMGLDPRFRALFIAVAGSDFPSIYAYSANTIVAPLRVKHMDYLGIKRQKKYENFLRNYLRLDPSVVTRSNHLSNISMIIAEKDTVVPATNQWELWKSIKAMGIHPKTYIAQTQHILGALHLVRYRYEIIKLLESSL